jgi:hypothetical protein
VCQWRIYGPEILGRTSTGGPVLKLFSENSRSKKTAIETTYALKPGFFGVLFSITVFFFAM